MRVKVYMAENTDYCVNVRDVDALGEELGLTDAEMDHIDDELRDQGRAWVGPYYLSLRGGQ